MTDSLNFPKARSIPKFYVALVLCGLIGNAAGAPFIEWVSPPAWLETQQGNEPVQPGTSLHTKAWITTGREGKVLVRLTLDQVELEENSMWEWQGQDNGSTGNTLQGHARVGSSTTRTQAVNMGDGPIRIQFNAPWTLVLNVGDQETNAQRLVLYLRKSGYPLQTQKQLEANGDVTWQLRLDGLMSNEAAITMGKKLMGLAPGIVSAGYQLNAPSSENAGTQLRFSGSTETQPNAEQPLN